MTKPPEELLKERTLRFENALRLEQTDRVPVIVTFDFFAARYAGITCEEAMFEYDKMMMAWTKTIFDFQPDAYDNPFASHFRGRLLQSLDYKPLLLPGYGVGKNCTYQFLEGEPMPASDYTHFLSDLSDYMLRKFLPRTFGALKAFGKLPSPREMICYYMGIDYLDAIDEDEISIAVQSLRKAKQAAQQMNEGAATFDGRMEKLSFPPQFGAITQAPYDTLADFFRGMRGSMLDMYRNVDKLLEATETLLPVMIDLGVRGAKLTGIPRVFIPIHKGIDSFMSAEQFQKFYWPTLRKLILALIDAGLTPCLLWEGVCDTRLEKIADIPKGKACYAFEGTNMLRAKEILGGHVCLRGNLPSSLLCTGTPEQVKEYCKWLIDNIAQGGGYIMDASAGLDQEKPENVRAMIQFTMEYGVYR